MTLPWSFVTQGAMAVHVYSEVTVPYATKGDGIAYQPATTLTTILVLNEVEHEFCVSGGSNPGCDSIYNMNEFKKNPGNGGRATKLRALIPLLGSTSGR